MSDFPLLLASEMGVSRRTVQRWCEAGEVPGAYRTKGGHWRLRKPRIKRNGKWNYDENITEFVIRYTSDGGYFPPPIPNSLLVDAVKKWIRRLQKNPAPLTAEEAGTLEWARTIIDRQTADEMEQLTASQEFNDALEYSHVAHGISQDDRREITHRDPKERWRLTMQLKDLYPEKFRYLLQTPMHELISEHAYDNVRKPLGMLMVKAKNLGPNMTSASLARELKISVATLYRPPYGRDAVKRARDYAHGAPVRDEVSIADALTDILSDKGHHLL